MMKKGKTYCFFTAHYLPYLGGVERYTFNVAKELVSRGNQVLIVTTRMPGEQYRETQDAIEIFRLDSFNLLEGRFPVLRPSNNNRKNIGLLKMFGIDRIVIQTRFYIISLFATIFARKNKIPFIVIEHGTGHFTVNKKILDFCGEKYEHTISFLMRCTCKNFYGVSKACNEWLRHFHIAAKGVIYNAIDLNDYNVDDGIYNLTDVPESVPIISYVGRLVKEKGIEKLVKAHQAVVNQGVQLSLCIAGDGDLLQQLENKELQQIYFLGKLSHGDVVKLLKSSLMFCLPTDYPEGFPTSVLEAVACKAYVITTKAGGSKELISDESLGTILRENSVPVIAEAIRKVLDYREEAYLATEKAYEKLCKYYVWSNVVTSLEEAFGGYGDEKV